jgi:hypothetical protein
MATQPGTGLAVFDPKAGAPAHVASFFEDAGTNIAPKVTVDSLSPQGKMWTLAISGQKSPLQRRNQDGDMEPLPIMKVVVLDYAKNRGRSYYEGAYDPAKEQAPICWSDDGNAPHASLPGPFPAGTAVEPGSARKISASCANCPMAVKGSKVDNTGKARAACSVHKMLAVLPDPALGLPETLQKPLRLKIAITSIWDNESPDEEQQGWMAFDKYVDWLLARGVQHTAALVTKMKFDSKAAYPKIFFAAERYLEANELAVVAPMSKSDDVKKLLGGTWTPAGVDGVPVEQQKVAEAQPATEQLVDAPAAPPTTYVMADGETFTKEQYIVSGWTEDQLIKAGKLVPVAAAAAPLPTPVPEAPPAPAAAPAQENMVVVGESPAPTAAVATTEVSTAPTVAPEAIVVVADTPATPPSPAAVLTPAEPPTQAPAQAEAPVPAPPPAQPDPPAAAAQAAAVTAEAGTNLPPELESLMAQWN